MSDTATMVLAVALAVPVIAALGIGLFLMIRDTVRGQGKWGLALNPPRECPECGEPVPMIRKPANRRQALWGGWTCSWCGCEIDKYGKVLSGPTHPDGPDEG